jgi:hypothetical protein
MFPSIRFLFHCHLKCIWSFFCKIALQKQIASRSYLICLSDIALVGRNDPTFSIPTASASSDNGNSFSSIAINPFNWEISPKIKEIVATESAQLSIH